jgi:peptidyl-tRNA hydrolase
MVPELNTDPILYILIRGDLASMNPGKAAAQACHAANLLPYACRMREFAGGILPRVASVDWFVDWEQECKGFGTTVVLQKPGLQGLDLVRLTEQVKRDGFVSGLVRDPTYPVPDGSWVHCVPLITCGFIFGPKDYISHYVKEFPLMP